MTTMENDQLWVRERSTADSDPVFRNHGQFYLYKRSPDSSEKLEMTFRSLGRQYDWDLEKYRLSNKPIDTGNQRRLMKNVARLAKNPLGYTYWKLHSKISRTSIFVGLCYLNIVGFAYHFLYLHQRRNGLQEFKLRAGVVERGNGSQKSLASDSLMGGEINDISQRMDIDPTLVIPAPGTNMGYRKHFDTRRAYGLSKDF